MYIYIYIHIDTVYIIQYDITYYDMLSYDMIYYYTREAPGLGRGRLA